KATSRATTTSWRCRGLQWPRSKPQPSRSSHAANERLLHPLTPQIRCSSPPPCGEGLGVGVVRFFRRWRHRALTASPPLPNPPPQGGRERTECGEREAHRERGEEDRVGESAYFVWLNRGKESVVLDLARADDKALLAAMLAKADVFVQNLKPGAIAKLGFPLDALRRAHPRLVICSISGYGEDGPYAHRKAYEHAGAGRVGARLHHRRPRGAGARRRLGLRHRRRHERVRGDPRGALRARANRRRRRDRDLHVRR